MDEDVHLEVGVVRDQIGRAGVVRHELPVPRDGAVQIGHPCVDIGVETGVRIALHAPRVDADLPATTLQAVSDRIGEQKRRLPGLAYTLLPLVVIGWLPHGLLRRAGRVVLNNVLSSINRALAITNIGALDETLAPLGEEVEAASVIGPFVHGLPVPLVTATGFRRELTLHVEATGTLAEQALDDYAEELREVLER